MRSVLVVDDEFGIVDSLSEVLSDEGFAVATARNGKDALRKIDEQRPDVILLDYMMPVMDGRETLRVLKSERIYRDIPVLLMSALPRANIPSDCTPDAFLRKPFDIDVLLAALGSLLSRTQR